MALHIRSQNSKFWITPVRKLNSSETPHYFQNLPTFFLERDDIHAWSHMWWNLKYLFSFKDLLKESFRKSNRANKRLGKESLTKLIRNRKLFLVYLSINSEDQSYRESCVLLIVFHPLLKFQLIATGHWQKTNYKKAAVNWMNIFTDVVNSSLNISQKLSFNFGFHIFTEKSKNPKAT